jgi:hypothetical protein
VSDGAGQRLPGPFSTAVFDWVEGKSGADNGGIVVPYYIVHKIMAGLLDANHYLETSRRWTS